MNELLQTTWFAGFCFGVLMCLLIAFVGALIAAMERNDETRQ